jgi:hypothetical protein
MKPHLLSLIAGLALGVTLTASARAQVLYVASFATNEMIPFDMDTGLPVGPSISGGGLLSPIGLAFGPGGDLFVASFISDSVIRFDVDTGLPVGFPITGGGLFQPSGLATLGPIEPEPETPAEQIAAMREDVQQLQGQGALNLGQANALLTKLNLAEQAVAGGRTNVASNVVGAFLNQVQALVAAGVLTPEQAGPLLEGADRLRQSLLDGGTS